MKKSFFRNGLVCAFAYLCLLMIPQTVLAEGTKQVDPTSTDITALYTNAADFNFAGFGASATNRLHIHIDDPSNQVLYIGLSGWMRTTNPINQVCDGNATAMQTLDGTLYGDTAVYYFQIVDPSGTVVHGPFPVTQSTANTNTWALGSAGPDALFGGGYSTSGNYTFNPDGLAAGDYYIEFSNSVVGGVMQTYALDPVTGTDAVTGETTVAVKHWDLTLATEAGAEIPGRVFSQGWYFRTPAIPLQWNNCTDGITPLFNRPFNGSVYSYSNDGFVNQINFNNSDFRGLSFILTFNETGTGNTGDVQADRQSVLNGGALVNPDYKVFLNNPDINVFPDGTIGTVTATPMIVECEGTYCIEVEVSERGLVEVLFDHNVVVAGEYEENTTDLLIAEFLEEDGSGGPYSICIPWNGLDGNNNPVDLNNLPRIYVRLGQGVTHFPAYDVEFASTGFNITPIRPSGGSFNGLLYYDDSNITFTPGGGEPSTALNGCSTPCHSWSNLDYGNLNTLNSWWFFDQSITTQIEVTNCKLVAVNDTTTTPLNTPVDMPLLANDSIIGFTIDTSSLDAIISI
ncbi:MAG: hypothetical protein AAGK97_09600 [Bacteroidota bacterium]